MDNTAKDNHFVFAIMVFLCLCLAIIAIFCGGEIMKHFLLMLVSFIGLCVFAVLLFVFWGIYLFSSPEKNTKNWAVYSDSDTVPKNVEKLFFDKNPAKSYNPLEVQYLKFVEIDTDNFDVNKSFFAKCQNLEEVTFLQRPKNFKPDTFSKNLALKRVNLLGERKDWSKFQITTPVDCEINFIKPKYYEIPEIVAEEDNKSVKAIEINANIEYTTKNENKKDYNGSSKKGK